MMNRIVLFFFLMMVTIACSEEKKIYSEEEKKELSRMIAELHAVKEMVAVYPYSQRDSVNNEMMNKFYAIHEIDSTHLAQTFANLREEPALLKELHDMAISDIETLMIQYGY